MCEEDREEGPLIDRACSLLMTGRLKYLRDFKPVTGGGHITVGNNASGTIRGYSVLTTGSFSMQQVSYVDGKKHNIISVLQLCKASHHMKFDNIYCYIMSSDRETCLIKSKVEGIMYPLDVSLIIGKPQLCILSKVVFEVSWLWHRKLAHLNF